MEETREIYDQYFDKYEEQTDYEDYYDYIAEQQDNAWFDVE